MPIQKWQLAPEFKADGGFEPETYMEYFEDSNLPANAEIGCKMPFLDGHYSVCRISAITSSKSGACSVRHWGCSALHSRHWKSTPSNFAGIWC